MGQSPRRPAGGPDTAHDRRAARRSVVAALGVLPDVLGHPLLERLELVEQLVGRDLLVRLALADQPRRRVDRGAPGRFLRLGLVLAGLVRKRLDLVQVDVVEVAALLLVVLDAGALALEPHRGVPDVLAERRVLLAVGVPDDVAGAAAARLERTHRVHGDRGVHGGTVTRLTGQHRWREDRVRTADLTREETP